jgi:hypothetical protein
MRGSTKTKNYILRTIILNFVLLLPDFLPMAEFWPESGRKFLLRIGNTVVFLAAVTLLVVPALRVVFNGSREGMEGVLVVVRLGVLPPAEGGEQVIRLGRCFCSHPLMIKYVMSAYTPERVGHNNFFKYIFSLKNKVLNLFTDFCCKINIRSLIYGGPLPLSSSL